MDAGHLLAAAFNIGSTHLSCDILTLLLRYWGQTLGFEEVDAHALGSEVGLEADEHEWRSGAEMEDFGVPLCLG